MTEYQAGIITATSNGDLVYRGRYCPEVIEVIRAIPGRQYVPASKVWLLPANEDVLEAFKGNILVSFSAEAKALISAKREAKERILAAKMVEKPEPQKPMPIKVDPFAHQVRAFNIGISNRYTGLLHEQGCGKTLTAIAVAGRRFLDGEMNKLLIVAPLSVIPVWQRELITYANFPAVTTVLAGGSSKRNKHLEDIKSGREAAFPERLNVILINYESVWRPGMYDILKSWQPDMIIADESQKIKGPTTKQSRGMHKLGEVASYRMILTGTPITAGPMDFFSQYRFLDSSIFGKSYYSYRNRYAIMGGFEGKQIVAYKNKQELVQKAHSIAHRVTKEEALDLPGQIDQQLYCELEPAARRAYKEMLRTKVAEIETEQKEHGRLVATNVLTRLLRLQQMVGGWVPADPDNPECDKMLQVSSAKVKLLKETVNDLLAAGHKIVIFARFVAEIEAMIEMFQDFKVDTANGVASPVDVAYIYGKVKIPDRGEMVERFQTDPNCKVFIAQVQTAGLGITLHAADTAIFYSADFNYANYDQCRARIHRIGQRHVVNYIHLIAQDTVDEKIYDVISNKKSLAVELVDHWQKYFS